MVLNFLYDLISKFGYGNFVICLPALFLAFYATFFIIGFFSKTIKNLDKTWCFITLLISLCLSLSTHILFTAKEIYPFKLYPKQISLSALLYFISSCLCIALYIQHSTSNCLSEEQKREIGRLSGLELCQKKCDGSINYEDQTFSVRKKSDILSTSFDVENPFKRVEKMRVFKPNGTRQNSPDELNLSQIKSMIYNLKMIELTIEENIFLDELLLFIEKFKCHRPSPNERDDLSNKLLLLVKLTAKYQHSAS